MKKGSKLFGIFSKSRKEVHVNVEKGWKLTVNGELTELKKLDIDKSGKNPKYKIYGIMQVVSYELEGAVFEVPELLHFEGLEKDFEKHTSCKLEVGEQADLIFRRVQVTSNRFIFTG